MIGFLCCGVLSNSKLRLGKSFRSFSVPNLLNLSDRFSNPMVNFISRVEAASLPPEVFARQYQKNGIPVVITGLLPPELDWNLDYLKQKLGDREFLFRNYGSQRYKQARHEWTNIGSGVDLQRMPFSKFTEMLDDRQAHEQDINLGKCLLKNTPLTEQAQLFQTIGKHLGLTHPASDLRLYVNPSGHRSGLHYDAADGTLMQLHGSKKVVLFPPSQLYNLYPFPLYIHLRYGLRLRSVFSQVSSEQPNVNLFPKFKEALQHKHEAILNRGDVLYIPTGWWHDVIALGDEMVCSMSQFWHVYPLSRGILSWSRWRAGLGLLCASPHLAWNFLLALFSRDRNSNLSQFLHRI